MERSGARENARRPRWWILHLIPRTHPRELKTLPVIPVTAFPMTPFPVTSFPGGVISRDVISGDVISCCVISCYVISCDAISRNTISCDVISRNPLPRGSSLSHPADPPRAPSSPRIHHGFPHTPLGAPDLESAPYTYYL